MTLPYQLTLTELVQKIKSRELTSRAVVASFLERITQLEPAVQAWVFLNDKWANEQAAAIDERIKAGKEVGRLAGVPVGVKDVFNSADFPTEMGSGIWKGFTPGNDARPVFNLREDDAVMVGKTTTSEFAVHEPTKTRNPHNLECGPGTSSAGSAAAVACAMVPAALGTQTGGSVIRPASYCGVFGYKPTFGLVPRTGVLKTTDTLDTVGWFGRSVDDIELLFESLRVRGMNYPFVDKYVHKTALKSTVKVGIFTGPNWKHAAPEAIEQFDAAMKKIADTGKFETSAFELPEFAEIFEAHERIYCRALSYYFRAEQRNTRDSISKVLLRMLDDGEKIQPADYARDIKRQAEITQKYFDSFPVDVVATLSAGGEVPVGLNAPDRPDSCKIWTYLGLPVISLPLFTGASGRPIGLQLIGRKYSDYQLLEAARQIAQLFNKPVAPIATPQRQAVLNG